MKRSAQVTLALVTAAGLGAGAYALAPSNACRPPEPNTAPRDLNAVPRDPPPDCRSSGGHTSGGHSGGHGASLFSSNSGSGAAPAASTTSTTSRGGFGSIGHAMSSGGG